MSNNDAKNDRRQHRPLHASAAIGAVILAGAMCLTGGAQTMTLDTPSDLEHARIKAEKAWKAWEAQGHIEPKLLSMPADRALTEIRKDGKLAEQYLAARQVQI